MLLTDEPEEVASSPNRDCDFLHCEYRDAKSRPIARYRI